MHLFIVSKNILSRPLYIASEGRSYKKPKSPFPKLLKEVYPVQRVGLTGDSETQNPCTGAKQRGKIHDRIKTKTIARLGLVYRK